MAQLFTRQPLSTVPVVAGAMFVAVAVIPAAIPVMAAIIAVMIPITMMIVVLAGMAGRVVATAAPVVAWIGKCRGS